MNSRNQKTLTEEIQKQIVERITRNFLDILVLRLIQTEPMWGYKIIKKTERLFGVKLRHGALYPLLNTMESEGYVKSRRITKQGRVRKIYEITQKGKQLVDAYHELLRQQLEGADLKEV